jgi:sulfur-carrier protein
VGRGSMAVATIPDMNASATGCAPAEVTRHPVVTVRYWAAARAAAGCHEERFVGATVAEVMAAALAAHRSSPRFAQVLGVSSLVLGDRPLGSADLDHVAVQAGDVVEVLPPFAGGAAR